MENILEKIGFVALILFITFVICLSIAVTVFAGFAWYKAYGAWQVKNIYDMVWWLSVAGVCTISISIQASTRHS